MFRFLVPPEALLVFVVLTLGGLAIGVTLAAWLVAALVAFFRHDGLTTLLQFPREYVFLPTIAAWFDDTDKTIWNWGAVPALIAGIAGGGIPGIRLARVLVVKKFKWMTDEEVDAMLKRDPGW